MPPPPSYIDITSIPFSRVVTQAEFNGGTFGGVANEVWFRYVTAIPIALGNFTNKGNNFVPVIRLYESDGSTLIKTINPTAGTTIHGWYRAVVAGTYFLRITRSGGGASDFDFTADFDTRPVDDFTINDGDLVINDDTATLPGTLYSSDGTLKSIVTAVPAGEIASILPSQTNIWHDTFGFYGVANDFVVLDGDLVFSASSGVTMGDTPAACHSTENFFVADAAGAAQTYRITPEGVGTLLGSLPVSFALSAIGSNLDGTVLYWTDMFGDASIHQWDTMSGSPLPDLYTIPGYDTGSDLLALTDNGLPGDIITLTDGSIVLWYQDVSATDQYIILHISSAGVLLHSYAQADPLSMDHLAPVEGSATTVAIWQFVDSGNTIGRWGILDVETGTITGFDAEMFRNGINLVANSAVMFGPSQSCSFVRFATAGPVCPGLASHPRIDGLPYVPPEL